MRKTRLWALIVLMVLVGALAGCSDDQIASVDPETPSDRPTEGAAATSSTTTVDPETSSVEPSVLTEAKLGRVYIAPNGNDGRSGAAPNQAVRSLSRALTLLAPGGTVTFQPGTYAPLRIEGVRGEAGSPIRLEASGAVEFRDRDYRSGAGILIRNAQHVEVVGMRIRHALWGMYIDNSHHVTVKANDVGDIGQEGIRIKGGSTNIRVDGNTVADTGRRTDQGPANGEGIYIGTGTPGGVDHVNNIVVINNRIMRVTDEAIDVKRPATKVDIIGNTISDVVTQTSGALVVHLNGDQSGDPQINIERNVIRNVTRSSPYRDGNCIVSQVTVRIVNNVLQNCQHRGIYLRGSLGTATVIHNTLVNVGNLGSVVSEGRGMRIISENNLGAAGGANRTTGSASFVDVGGGNLRLAESAPQDLREAPNKGISNDITGARRPQSGAVTFGAYESIVREPTSPSPPVVTNTTTTSARPPRDSVANSTNTIAPTSPASTTTQRTPASTPTTQQTAPSTPTTQRTPASTTTQRTPASTPTTQQTAPSTPTTQQTAASTPTTQRTPASTSTQQTPASTPLSKPSVANSTITPGTAPTPRSASPQTTQTKPQERASSSPSTSAPDHGSDPAGATSCLTSLICEWAPFL